MSLAGRIGSEGNPFATREVALGTVMQLRGATVVRDDGRGIVFTVNGVKQIDPVTLRPTSTLKEFRAEYGDVGKR